MSDGVAGSATAAVIAKALKAMRSIVQLKPRDFENPLALRDNFLVVTSTGGYCGRNCKYLNAYRGFVFYTATSFEQPLNVEERCGMIRSRKIWIPQNIIHRDCPTLLGQSVPGISVA